MPATKKNIKTIVKTKNTKKIKQQPKLIPFTTLIKKGTIHRGSGGSSNFIIVYKNTVLKIIPNFSKHWNQKEKDSHDQEELAFYNYLTKHLVNKKKTPHIVASYGSIKINILDLLTKYSKYCDKPVSFWNKLTKGVSSDYNEDDGDASKPAEYSFFQKLLKWVGLSKKRSQQEKPSSEKDKRKATLKSNLKKTICDFRNSKCGPVFMRRYRAQPIERYLDGIYLENCSSNISKYFTSKTLKISPVQPAIQEFITRVSFQYLFTMCAIYSVLPTFVHNDMFLRNILATDETHYKPDEFVEYSFIHRKKKYIFHLPANGIYIKLNDFGFSVAPPKLGDPVRIASMKRDARCHMEEQHPPNMGVSNTFNSDTFNFFHDLYDGADMGGDSLSSIVKKEIKNKNEQGELLAVVKKELDKYIDTKRIDGLNKKSRDEFNWLWNIDLVKELHGIVDHPMEYLVDKTLFSEYHGGDNGKAKIPKNKIVARWSF